MRINYFLLGTTRPSIHPELRLWDDSATVDGRRVHQPELTCSASANGPIMWLNSGADVGIFLPCQRANKTLESQNWDSAYCTLLCFYPSCAFILRLRGLRKAEQGMKFNSSYKPNWGSFSYSTHNALFEKQAAGGKKKATKEGSWILARDFKPTVLSARMNDKW